MTQTSDGPAAAAKFRRKAERAATRVASRRRAVVWLKLLRAAVRWLPLSVACLLGDGLGSLAWFCAGRARRQSLAHLALAFPEASAAKRRHISRRCFALLGRGMLAFVVLHRMGKDRALARIRVEGEEAVLKTRAENKGGIYVSFHFGMFEMFATYVGGRLGVRPVSRPDEGGGPTEMLLAMRRDLGCETILRGDVRELLRSLRRGEGIALLIDQDSSDVNGAFVPFFGRLAHTATGAAVLAVRTGAPVLMGFIEWEGLTRHRAHVLPAILPRTDLAPDEAVLELTARMTRMGEAEVRRRPDHWVWMHRRWQTRPEDHPELPVFTGVTS